VLHGRTVETRARGSDGEITLLVLQTAVLRAILAVPGHCAGGVIIAVGVCERVFYGKDTNAFWILLPSVLFHGFYDW
jgi:hypothetical protein